MKEKCLVLLIALFAILGPLLFAAGGTEEEQATGKPGEPQYGGEMTWFTEGNAWMPASWDSADIWWTRSITIGPHLEQLLHGDIEKYGPRGTGVFGFRSGTIPEQYLKGQLAESWEVTPEKIAFQIRPGIMWAKSPIMESRELTAKDVEHSMKRLIEGFRVKGPGRVAFIDDVRATDKYTVVFDTNKFFADWSAIIGYDYMTQIQPPEVVEAGAAEWTSWIGVGTGPFLLENYIEDNLATYVRNPNYWDTTTIDGVEYELPFVDKLQYPFIEDTSTQIAALRTGKIDFMQEVHLRYYDTLKDTSPDLILKKEAEGNTLRLVFRTDHEPFNDINVRRALNMAIDKEAIGRAVYGEALKHGFPVGPGAGAAYTPFEELPESAKELYEYNPAKAKQMLADAGYPNGFSTEILFRPHFLVSADATAMVAANWEDIGVTVKMNGLEESAFVALAFYPGEFQQAILGGASNHTNPLGAIGEWVKPGTSRWTDEYAIAEYNKAAAESDPAVRSAILKDLAVYVLEAVPTAPIGGSMIAAAYWPWLKNYYGETVSAHYYTSLAIQARIWIDESLKKELGY